MAIYGISILMFVLILITGLIIVRRAGIRSEKAITRLCIVGFLCQILINWMFWGNGAIYNPFVHAVADKSSLTFLVLCLISIFCYSALLLLLYKANEFYNE